MFIDVRIKEHDEQEKSNHEEGMSNKLEERLREKCLKFRHAKRFRVETHTTPLSILRKKV